MSKTTILIGAPVDSGKRNRGCLMGPDAYRTAGLAEALQGLGFRVRDRGNLAQPEPSSATGPEGVHAYGSTCAWTHRLSREVDEALKEGLPIVMGGDHALAAGSVLGAARFAARAGRPLFVLWLDAHSDINTPESSESGNMHGMPVAFFTGRGSFPGFPEVATPVPDANICMIGLRSVDPAEREVLAASDIRAYDMRHIDENGIVRPLAGFLEEVEAANGMLHVSLDVDFLDPSVAPAVGTTVPGGATVREGHLVMEMLHDSGLMTSLDLVELNPFMDERGRTATLMVDLAASALGRRVFDRPTRAYQ